MSKKTKQTSSLERLTAVLDIYGADQARWPRAERRALAALAQEPDAAKAVAETRALEAVMAIAPAGIADDAFKQRIVTAALSDGAREARVVPISAGRRASPPRSRNIWRTAALAASFAFGLYLGVSGVGEAALQIAQLNMVADEAESISWFAEGSPPDMDSLL